MAEAETLTPAQEAHALAFREAIKAGLMKNAGSLVAAGHLKGKIEGEKVTLDPKTDWGALTDELIASKRKNAPTLGGKTLEGKVLEKMNKGFGKAAALAGHMEAAVEENTGSLGGATFGQVFKAFWESDDKLGFIGMIIGALIAMIFGGQSFADAFAPLTAQVAPITADAVSGSLQKRLEADEHFSKDEIAQSTKAAKNAVLAKAGLATENDFSPEIQQTISGDQIKEIKGEIDKQIAGAMGLKLIEGDHFAKIIDPSEKPSELAKLDRAKGKGNELTPAQVDAIGTTLSSATYDLITNSMEQKTPDQVLAFYKDQVNANAAKMGIDTVPGAAEIMANTAARAYVEKNFDKTTFETFSKELDPKTTALTKDLIQMVATREVNKLFEGNEQVIDNVLGVATNSSITDKERGVIKSTLVSAIAELSEQGTLDNLEKNKTAIAKHLTQKLAAIEGGLGQKLAPYAGKLADALTGSVESGASDVKGKLSSVIKDTVKNGFKDTRGKLAAMGMDDKTIDAIQTSVENGLVKTIIETPNFSQKTYPQKAVAYSQAIQEELKKSSAGNTLDPEFQKKFASLVAATTADGIAEGQPLNKRAYDELMKHAIKTQVLTQKDSNGKTIKEKIASQYMEGTSGLGGGAILGLKKSPEDLAAMSEKMSHIVAESFASAVVEKSGELAKKLSNKDEAIAMILREVEMKLDLRENEVKAAGFGKGRFSDGGLHTWKLEGMKKLVGALNESLNQGDTFQKVASAFNGIAENDKKVEIAELAKQANSTVAIVGQPINYKGEALPSPALVANNTSTSTAANR